jgi:glutamate-1-semialdehyde 2,1-aminomutase
MDPNRDVYGHLEGLAQQLEKGQRRLFAKHGITTTIIRQGSAHCVYFMDRVPQNWWELLSGNDFEFDRVYRKGLIERGIYHFPVPTKQGSISYAHTRDDIDQTLQATDELLKAMN